MKKKWSSKPIAIIPARGNSKRLPRKNILPWKGIPLIGYSIKNAISSNVFSEVIVSSEDNEILDYAEYYGAKTIKRNNNLSKDTSTVVEVCTDVIADFYQLEYFCCIYATAVKLSAKTIQNSLKEFNKIPDCKFLMGVSLYNYPPQQALITNELGELILMNPEFKGVQSQHFKECYVSNGTFYWANTKSFLKEKSFYGTNLQPFVVSEEEVTDINTKEDYKILCES